MALDSFGSLRETLPDSSSEGASSTWPEQPQPLRIKVLLWNIHGPGKADLRNQLVPHVARAINPDVLLLQETKTDLLVNTIRAEVLGRNYTEVQARDRKESRVLYDSNIYEAIPHTKRSNLSLEEVLDKSIKEVFPNDDHDLREGCDMRGKQRVVKNRVSIVGLRRRGLPNSDIVVFMSFHNVNNREGGAASFVPGFLRMVHIIGELTGCVVVVGTDLNHHLENPGPNVPLYEPTLRRTPDTIIDYFILDKPPNVQVQSDVTAWDFIEASDDDLNPLHEVMRDLLRPPTPGGEAPTIDQYGRAVDHDPLVYELTIPAVAPN